MLKKTTVSIVSGLAIILSTSVPVFADTTSNQSTEGNTVTTKITIPVTVSTSSGIQSDASVTGDAGTATLTMFNGGSRTQIDANWQLKSTVGQIEWEDVTVTLSNGQSQNYDGPGPIIKSTASGQFTFSGLKPGTKYSGTLSGWIETDEIDTATIGPVTDYATTLS
ncbi:hypothetical protein [Alicyclobacillus suci]|uniref:hypothetical protein n=1 Tax=Alicyclobacillus suci TaxID=2816080 RepID=UPI001A8E2C66|nr:hypothetical protein [Alicyclobacillus suci]